MRDSAPVWHNQCDHTTCDRARPHTGNENTQPTAHAAPVLDKPTPSKMRYALPARPAGREMPSSPLFGWPRWVMADEAVQAYYGRDEERDRLASGLGRVEFWRTVEIIGRTLPAPPARIADIGGGPGRYTDWLLDAGYDVVHRDLVAHHVDQVRARHGSRVDSAVGDARALDLPDDCVDHVLLLGPLYHLEDHDDRLPRSVKRRRVVRAGGVVHVAAISRWAPRLHGMLVQHVHLAYPVMAELIVEMERTGVMSPFHDTSFNGYTHTPDEFRAEVRASDLVVESLVSVEGIAFALCDLDDRWDDPQERALLLDVLRAVESVPELLGVGPHLLATARKR